MSTSSPQEPQSSNPLAEAQFASLERYISGMWRLGGMPLVLVAFGAANLFIPYSETHKLILTSFLFFAGLVTWCTVTYIAFKRWQHEMHILAEQDSKVIGATVELLVKGEDTGAAQKRVDALIASLKGLGIRTPKETPQPLPPAESVSAQLEAS